MSLIAEFDDYQDFLPVFEGYEGESEAEALRLVYRTELNRSYSEYTSLTFMNPVISYKKRAVCVRDYGFGIVEVGYSSAVALPSPFSVKDDPEHRCKTKEEAEANLLRSLSRSKAQVRRKCMSGRLDYLLTLTYRSNVNESYFSDNASTFKDLTRFVRLVRKSLPGWKYLAVLEKHKSGANHLHLAVSGFQNVHFLRACWLKVVGDGNIDVKKPRHAKGLWHLAKLASYISKYITKSVSSEHARQRYRVAEGIKVPEQRAIVEFPLFYADFLQDLFDSLSVKISHHWKSENSGHGWACSW